MIVAGGIDTGIVIGVENRKEYKVMNVRCNDVQLEDILNESLQMYISHMEQKGVQIMDCRVNIDTTDDRGSCTGGGYFFGCWSVHINRKRININE